MNNKRIIEMSNIALASNPIIEKKYNKRTKTLRLVSITIIIKTSFMLWNDQVYKNMH